MALASGGQSAAAATEANTSMAEAIIANLTFVTFFLRRTAGPVRPL
jgi:hypothetical protein